MSRQRELLVSLTRNDFELQTFRSGGPGGQHQNKRDSGVRIIHRASGARGESREKRSQVQNKRLAFTRLAETDEFQAWIKRAAAKAAMSAGDKQRVRREIRQSVMAQMRSENLCIEYVIDDEWREDECAP